MWQQSMQIVKLYARLLCRENIGSQGEFCQFLWNADAIL